jgi:hypothetical protein
VVESKLKQFIDRIKIEATKKSIKKYFFSVIFVVERNIVLDTCLFSKKVLQKFSLPIGTSQTLSSRSGYLLYLLAGEKFSTQKLFFLSVIEKYVFV